ncbi:MAG TPA: PIN domain-containing protein [Pseudacidobacterium sp.]|nr:PIN domain-containing protein [Pseudacidobacterium sp.]
MKPVLLDTGVVVALLDRSEKHHTQCVAVVGELTQPLVTCEAVIAESCYLLQGIAGAAEAVLENVEQGIFQLPFQLSQSASVVKTIMRKYRDMRADLADACLIHLADMLDTGKILTLDSDFAAYRWRRTRHFEPLVAL